MTRLKPVSGGFQGLCPFHKERTPSFHVSDTRQTYKCFGCGAQGDVFDWVMTTKGMSFIGAVDELAGAETIIPGRPTRQDGYAKSIEDDSRRIKHAHEIWLKRQPIYGTVAERYLYSTRAIPGPFPAILGHTNSAYCSVLAEETDALIAPLQDSNGHVTAVQQIFLCRETNDAWRDPAGKRVKRTLGAMRDGCVRLGVPDTTLGLAGSIEDAMAASALYSLPVWATCGEHRMAKVWVPDEIEQVILFADADDAGLKAAQEARRAHHTKGRRITIMMPGAVKDWSDEIQQRVTG